jgi:predicted regulator of Ras-like GTPase activity (Roadblock/LC7/MglB family)/Tfp pilus assembly protein PilF
VVRGGLSRYPQLAAGHDLLARIHTDRGEGDAAFDAWTEALRHDPRHLGALRGLAFLAFRAGDLVRAERHLVAAVELNPEDTGGAAALARVREQLSRASRVASHESAETAPSRDSQLATRDALAEPDTVLVDSHGLRLAGAISGPDGTDVSDRVAAEVAGVAREAARAARLLELGAWKSLSIEGSSTQLRLVPPTGETTLLARATGDMPGARLAVAAERAAQAARRWLERGE